MRVDDVASNIWQVASHTSLARCAAAASAAARVAAPAPRASQIMRSHVM